MEKLDLRRRYRELYSPSAKKPSVVDVPDLLFTMIDGVVAAGAGPSESDDFLRAMEAMYGVAYGLKFMSKLRQVDPVDFTVMAVEGLWTPASGTMEFGTQKQMDFTLLMLQPDHITADMVESVVADTRERRPNPALEDIRLQRWREGLAVQVMHVGPYADEGPTLERLEQFAADGGYRIRGRHHEIYLGDPRRAKPENLKTILRLPVES
jgi:hypothetical protein